ncbi:MAG: glutamate-cysteine ligase family protein [bacterium]
MTQLDPKRPITLSEARERIVEQVFEKGLGGAELGRIGLEPEFLVLRVDEGGEPVGRVPLEGQGSVLEALEPLVAAGEVTRAAGPPPVFHLPNGGRITFEPGAQVEHSTCIHENAAAAMEDVEQTAALIERAMARVGGQMVAVGCDVWSDRSLVEQQLRAPRYHAMAAYFDRRSPHGRVMMRHTTSLQVNLDLGSRVVATRRWHLGNLLAPLASASFACSPEDGAVSRRAQAWQGLDPSRTGFPKQLLTDACADPGESYAEFALDADVLLFGGGSSAAQPGRAGFRMADWIQSGHPEHGRPQIADLDYHLSTLFPEVRLRGFFELRSCDGVPARWRGVNAVFWAGLFYDSAACEAALELLEPSRASLSAAWLDAARAGLASPFVRDLAAPIWDLALAGAARLPGPWFRPADLAAADEFIGRFIRPLRSPALELAAALVEGPAQALAWTRR